MVRNLVPDVIERLECGNIDDKELLYDRSKQGYYVRTMLIIFYDTRN